MKVPALPASKDRAPFRVKFWGVRGRYPTVDAATLKVGGNTSCVEVQADGRRLIFDAGTGIIPLGKQLCDGAASAVYIFLSHTHIDHVMGLCFFEPLLTPSVHTFILGPGDSRGALTRSLRHLTHSDLFPVSLDELKGKKEIFSLEGGEVIRFPSHGGRPQIARGRAVARVQPEVLSVVAHKSSAHPLNGVMLYRIYFHNKSLVYATDIEQQQGGDPDVIEFSRGADLLIHDAQYLKNEYFARGKPRKGWGHSTVDLAIEVAKKANVKRLALFHHEPAHNDKTMKVIASYAKRKFSSSIVAHEGMEINLS
jgi:phosphoribosyl 1,2-cyclic phosphodiesterase